MDGIKEEQLYLKNYIKSIGICADRRTLLQRGNSLDGLVRMVRLHFNLTDTFNINFIP